MRRMVQRMMQLMQTMGPWRALLVVWMTGLALPAFAQSGLPWTTDTGVGPNQVVYTVTLDCPNVGFVCDQIDGYQEQDTSQVSGGAGFALDRLAETIQFETDSSQDVGAGLQDAYLTLVGSDLVFPNIAFAGVPEITDVLVFALTNPLVAVPGVGLLVPGDYPFSQTIGYSGSGTVVGDLEFILGPDIVVPQDDIVVNGILRVLGDTDSNGTVEYEIRDVVGSFSLQSVATIGGESVGVDVSADMTLNLSGELAGAGAVVPALGPAGLFGLAGCLLLANAVAGRRRWR